MTEVYKVVETNDINEWTEYLNSNKNGTFYHHPGWLDVLEKEYNREVKKFVCKDENGKVIGIMPLSLTKGFPLGLGGIPASKRISSLPRTPVAGPLTDNNEALKLLLETAIEKAKEMQGFLLQIKSLQSNLNSIVEEFEALPWRFTYIKELNKNPDELRFGNSRNHNRIKWAINKAEKSGVELKVADSEEELKNWYKLYSETMQWHVVPVRPYRFFKNLWDNLKPKGLVELLLAVHNNKGKSKIIAGSVLFKFNNTVFYAFNGRDKDELSLRPNDFIQWHAMHRSKDEGYLYYDLGEVAGDNDGLDKFKGKWDCEVKQIYHYYYPFQKELSVEIDPEKVNNLKKLIWQKMPLGVTQKISDFVYRYL